QDRRAWQEVIERLLLDRVNAKAGRAPIGREDNLVAPCAHEAKAPLPFVQPAVARAQVALDATVRQGMPVTPSFTPNLLIHVARGLRVQEQATSGDPTTAEQDAMVAQDARTRPPAVAGHFYPRDPAQLRSEVQDFLAASAPGPAHYVPLA